MAEDPKSPYDPKPAAAPATAATPRRLRLPLPAVALFVGVAVNLALCLRSVRDDPASLAFFGFTHINLLSLFVAIGHFENTPPGSPERGRGRVAVWLLTTTLTAAYTWKIGTLLPLGFAVAAWVMAAATVLGGYYRLVLHGEK